MPASLLIYLQGDTGTVVTQLDSELTVKVGTPLARLDPEVPYSKEDKIKRYYYEYNGLPDFEADKSKKSEVQNKWKEVIAAAQEKAKTDKIVIKYQGKDAGSHKFFPKGKSLKDLENVEMDAFVDDPDPNDPLYVARGLDDMAGPVTTPLQHLKNCVPRQKREVAWNCLVRLAAPKQPADLTWTEPILCNKAQMKEKGIPMGIANHLYVEAMFRKVC
mmetsp:Transcript_38941/g.98188  ORF Transcript_38941/g.98188 Transcript_38941/m.98188 type:complete len:217 (-) Transcript_38941:484-1134(-)|eukprot:CAMPEP_0177651804 /NCGR_PEP_ID=MMETSP0447-20121125/12755_1 /TAXON_ID=0 /ORGANISM="Stygamoeba regulata, Strain BSH-02190019" /LENGTH=216 /DNA_ID=CAMNT_0019154933 /DNA_START=101 /DNA_END=751 /DNA_ORIENTATION=+